MSQLSHLGGMTSLVVAAGCWAATGGAITRRLDPPGSLRVVTGAVVAASAATVTLVALGTVGLLDRVPILALSAVLAGAASWWGRRRHPDRPWTAAPQVAAEPRWIRALALGSAGATTGLWSVQVVRALRTGITDFDSVNYHLTHAAAFVESGSIGGAHAAMADPFHAFHPMGQSLLGAGAIALAGTDLAVPLLHLGWLLLAFAAAWALGQPRGLGWSCVAVASVAVAVPAVAAFSGSATTDQPSIALALAAAALLSAVRDRPELVAVAGLAAGLAVGTKLSAVPVIAVLVLVVLLTGALPRRRLWLLGGAAALTGGAWYVRNVLIAGSPLPAMDLPVLRRTPTPVFDAIDDTLLDAVRTLGLSEVARSLMRALTTPGLVLVAIVLAIAAVAVLRGGPTRRLLGLAGLAGVVAYVVTPLSGTTTVPGVGPGFFVMANARYAMPAVALAGIAAVLMLWPPWRWVLVTASAGVVGLAVLEAARPETDGVAILFGPALGLGPAAWAALGAGTALVGAEVHRRSPLPDAARGVRLVGVGLLVALGTVGATLVADRYDRTRYAEPDGSVLYARSGPVLTWIEDQPPLAIAAVGLADLYPLAGADARHAVTYLGVQGPWSDLRAAASCAELRAAVNAMQPDAIVADVGGLESVVDVQHAVEWLTGAPNLRLVAEEASRRVFAVEGATSAAGCPD